MDTCLTKTLLESFTVMSPEATKDVFDLKWNVVGAVGLAAVIMIFGMIFSVFLCCAIHHNCSKSYKSKNRCTRESFIFFFFIIILQMQQLAQQFLQKGTKKGASAELVSP